MDQHIKKYFFIFRHNQKLCSILLGFNEMKKMWCVLVSSFAVLIAETS